MRERDLQLSEIVECEQSYATRDTVLEKKESCDSWRKAFVVFSDGTECPLLFFYEVLHLLAWLLHQALLHNYRVKMTELNFQEVHLCSFGLIAPCLLLNSHSTQGKSITYDIIACTVYKHVLYKQYTNTDCVCSLCGSTPHMLYELTEEYFKSVKVLRYFSV